MTKVTIASAEMTAEIAPRGAELVRLRCRDRDFLWHGDPTWWGGRAPILFPIVGRLPGDRIAIDGTMYSMPQHGLARISEFTCVAADAASAAFELAASAETKEKYPFDFLLNLRYEIAGATLTTTATVHNRSLSAMPFSIGFHPALLWPLPNGDRSKHAITFEKPEPSPVHKTRDGLTIPRGEASPVEGRGLKLADGLFEDGVIIFDALESRRLTLSAPASPTVEVAFPALPHLGIWSRPGAPFVCVEPWQGYATPEGFTGELRDKPGVVVLAAGKAVSYVMTIAISG